MDAPRGNTFAAGAGARSGAAGAERKNVEVVDLCYSSDDDEQQQQQQQPPAAMKSSGAASASSLKRSPGAHDYFDGGMSINGGSSNGGSGRKKKRPKPDPSAVMIDLLENNSADGEGSAAAAAAAAHDDDSDVELIEGPPSWSKWRQAASSSAAGQKENEEVPPAGRGNLKDDGEYEAAGSAKGGNKKDDEDDDDEFEIVGTKGQNALVDFPHSRENCVTHPFARGGSDDKKKHCPNCYCYVCDIPANDCKVWDAHCMASHSDMHWRTERDRIKRLGVEAAAAAPPAAAPAAAPAARAIVDLPAAAAARPRTNTTTQSYANRPNLTQYSIKTLLEKLTIVHPVEATPPANQFVTTLRHYQKQSLAYMLEVERSTGTSPINATAQQGGTMTPPIRGGWLCDEVGMGKSAVVLALVASEPLVPAPTADHVHRQIKRARRWQQDCDNFDARNEWPSRSREGRPKLTKMRLKATVIMTSVSLLGQWEDECKKHAPNLVVKVCHTARRGANAFQFLLTENLQDVDIILTTATYNWRGKDQLFCDAFDFHRVIMDESHLFATAAASANIRLAVQIKGGRRWCVTATPCTSSPQELKKQYQFLAESIWARAPITFPDKIGSKRVFYELLDFLKPMLVRHTKSQRINGSEALALPPSSTSTILVTMSASESHTCHNAIQTHLLTKYKQKGQSAFPLSRALGTMQGYGCGSKLIALRNDLQQLRSREPSLRAVVFTQYKDTHASVVARVQRDGFEVFQFTGSTNAKSRDKMIRTFQNSSSSRPAVFVITLKAGSVGITLTAASRVYLMEPCLDPAAELQAAGRIHRLGQNKPVQVVRYAFRNSPEQNIVRLHRKIAAGKVSITDGHVPPKAVKILAAGL